MSRIIAVLAMAATFVCPLRASAQSALERYEAADYREAARLGRQELLRAPQGPKTDELRLAVANSLAWTGDYESALNEYRALFGTRRPR